MTAAQLKALAERNIALSTLIEAGEAFARGISGVKFQEIRHAAGLLVTQQNVFDQDPPTVPPEEAQFEADVQALVEYCSLDDFDTAMDLCKTIKPPTPLLNIYPKVGQYSDYAFRELNAQLDRHGKDSFDSMAFENAQKAVTRHVALLGMMNGVDRHFALVSIDDNRLSSPAYSRAVLELVPANDANSLIVDLDAARVEENRRMAVKEDRKSIEMASMKHDRLEPEGDTLIEILTNFARKASIGMFAAHELPIAAGNIASKLAENAQRPVDTDQIPLHAQAATLLARVKKLHEEAVVPVGLVLCFGGKPSYVLSNVSRNTDGTLASGKVLNGEWVLGISQGRFLCNDQDRGPVGDLEMTEIPIPSDVPFWANSSHIDYPKALEWAVGQPQFKTAYQLAPEEAQTDVETTRPRG